MINNPIEFRAPGHDGAMLRKRRERQGATVGDIALQVRAWTPAHVETLEMCTSINARDWQMYGEALRNIAYKRTAPGA